MLSLWAHMLKAGRGQFHSLCGGGEVRVQWNVLLCVWCGCVWVWVGVGGALIWVCGCGCMRERHTHTHTHTHTEREREREFGWVDGWVGERGRVCVCASLGVGGFGWRSGEGINALCLYCTIASHTHTHTHTHNKNTHTYLRTIGKSSVCMINLNSRPFNTRARSALCFSTMRCMVCVRVCVRVKSV